MNPCRRRRFDSIAVCHCCIFYTCMYSMIVICCHHCCGRRCAAVFSLLVFSDLMFSRTFITLSALRPARTCLFLGSPSDGRCAKVIRDSRNLSKTTNQTETVRFLRHQHIHHDPQPNPVFAIEKGERRWKTDHGRPGRLYIYMHHRYVQMRILTGYELLKMKDGDVLNMFEYAWTMVWEKPDKPHKTCCLSDCHIRIVSLCQLCMVPVRRCKWRDDIWHILISLITMIQISIMILPSKV